MAKKSADIAKLAREIVMFDSYDDFEVDEIIKVLIAADDAYHNGKDLLLSDEQYDSLRRYAEQIAPTHKYFGNVGSDVRGGKVKLPFPMGSLTQVYEGEIEGWVKDRNLLNEDFCITDKLDGTSALIQYDKKGNLMIAFSRGDGIEGADITRHIRRFKSVPKSISNADLSIRGEVILSKKNFEILRTKVKSRVNTEYKNARNMVAGLMNAETNNPIVYDYLDFVAYDIVGDLGRSMNKDQMLELLEKEAFKVPVYTMSSGKDLNDKKATEYLNARRNVSDYEIDGIVIDVNSARRRSNLNPTRDTLNPAYAFKYKVADASNLAIAEVIGVEWNVSKHGYLKPRVNIKPVQLVGVTVQFATGFNAKFIYDNKIGPGAKVRITRSGDVIPFILGVVEPAAEPQMPSVDWRWNETKVDAVLSNPHDNEEVAIQQAIDFFTSIDAPNLKEGTVREVFEVKNHKDATSALVDMITMSEENWRRIVGSNGTKIYNGLRAKLTNIPLWTFLGATPYFGRGVGARKWKKLITGIGIKRVSELDTLSVAQICTVEGFNEKTAKKIVAGVNEFIQFYTCVTDYVTYAEITDAPTTGLMVGQKVCFTGVRSKEMEMRIVEEGGEIASGVSSKTTILVCLDPSSNSGKMKKARDLGIKLMTLQQLEEMLG